MLWEDREVFFPEILAGVRKDVGFFLRSLKLLVKACGKEYAGEQEEEFHAHRAVWKQGDENALVERG